MKDGTIPVHYGTRGLFRHSSVPACGKWSQRVTENPRFVTCGECKGTLDYALAEGAADRADARAELEAGQ